jgi:hypothetical protein
MKMKVFEDQQAEMEFIVLASIISMGTNKDCEGAEARAKQSVKDALTLRDELKKRSMNKELGV